MESRTWTCITAMILFAVLATPVRLVAQKQHADKKEHLRYTITDLGTLGGTFSQAFGINQTLGEWLCDLAWRQERTFFGGMA